MIIDMDNKSIEPATQNQMRGAHVAWPAIWMSQPLPCWTGISRYQEMDLGCEHNGSTGFTVLLLLTVSGRLFVDVHVAPPPSLISTLIVPEISGLLFRSSPTNALPRPSEAEHASNRCEQQQGPSRKIWGSREGPGKMSMLRDTSACIMIMAALSLSCVAVEVVTPAEGDQVIADW